MVSVVELVGLILAWRIMPPVTPPKIPVPPVNSIAIENVEVPVPGLRPIPEPVPISVPPENTSRRVVFVSRKCGGLVKSMVDCKDTLSEPKVVSLPLPVKFRMSTPDVLVGVSVAVPAKLPEIEPACAGTMRPHKAMRATMGIAIEVLIAKASFSGRAPIAERIAVMHEPGSGGIAALTEFRDDAADARRQSTRGRWFGVESSQKLGF
jgi:hypothetical protein